MECYRNHKDTTYLLITDEVTYYLEVDTAKKIFKLEEHSSEPFYRSDKSHLLKTQPSQFLEKYRLYLQHSINYLSTLQNTVKTQSATAPDWI